MNKRYTLSRLEHLTHELNQWKFDRKLTSDADDLLRCEAQQWRQYFETALAAGWIGRLKREKGRA